MGGLSESLNDFSLEVIVRVCDERVAAATGLGSLFDQVLAAATANTEGVHLGLAFSRKFDNLIWGTDLAISQQENLLPIWPYLFVSVFSGLKTKIFVNIS